MARTARAGFLELAPPDEALGAKKKPYWSRRGKAGVHSAIGDASPHGAVPMVPGSHAGYTGEEPYETGASPRADDFSEADGDFDPHLRQAITKIGVELSEVHRSGPAIQSGRA